jgi:hypothetical protein
MSMRTHFFLLPALAALLAVPVMANTVFISTGNPDGLMAAASRPPSAGNSEIETADDFVLTSQSLINGASFVGLLTGGATLSDIGQVTVEIYRIFPFDSDTGRTSGPPTFSTSQVPTRVNSPSDVAFDDRDSGSGGLTFTPAIIGVNFTAANSVQPGGIHAKPGQTTGGDGALTGNEVSFNVVFTTPFDLPADHYFFVPQVQVTSPNGGFVWLSAPKPIVAPGTPFPAGFTDLQAWTRDAGLDPDWLRIGTDIVGGSPAPTFNMAFTLSGETVPEPSNVAFLTLGLLVAVGIMRRRISLNRVPR